MTPQYKEFGATCQGPPSRRITGQRSRRVNRPPWTCGGSASTGPPDPGGARRETPARHHPVVQQDRRGDGDIDAEPGRNAHDMAAAGEQRGRQSAALGPEHIGGALRMGEARQVDGVVQQFEADELAAARQLQRLDRRIFVERHMLGRLGRIGLADHAQIHVRRDGEHEIRAEGVRRAKQTAGVHGLGDALDAQPEIPPHGGKLASVRAARQVLRGPPTRPENHRQDGTMRAIRIHQLGGLDALELEDIPSPEPGAGRDPRRGARRWRELRRHADDQGILSAQAAAALHARHGSGRRRDSRSATA